MTALSPRRTFSGTALKTIACITMLGDYKCYVDIVACQPAGHPVTCRSQTTRDVGRELPTEH